MVALHLIHNAMNNSIQKDRSMVIVVLFLAEATKNANESKFCTVLRGPFGAQTNLIFLYQKWQCFFCSL